MRAIFRETVRTRWSHSTRNPRELRAPNEKYWQRIRRVPGAHAFPPGCILPGIQPTDNTRRYATRRRRVQGIAGRVCRDFIITSSLPSDCIRIEKRAGLFSATVTVTTLVHLFTYTSIHAFLFRWATRVSSSFRPRRSTLLLLCRPWISSCAARVAPSTYIERWRRILIGMKKDAEGYKEKGREGESDSESEKG